MNTLSSSNLSDLQIVFDLAAGVLASSGVKCLLIGGFAVNYYGYTRNTLDVDWMIAAEQRDVVRAVMQREGFTNSAVHANVMFFQRPGSNWRVDFLEADAGTVTQLLSRVQSVAVHGVTVNVPALKDLIAMKLFSLAQNPALRMGKDLPDIVHLSVLNGLDLTRDIHPLAIRYASETVFKMVSDQIEALQA
ncbi:MAG: nucleotidyltransferase [Kiritimatiellae bacterium]|nr:nucleotidyltransferase [Kiritimatiellia bacterium]